MPAVTVFSSARPWSCTSSQNPSGPNTPAKYWALALVAVAEGEIGLEAEDRPDLARPSLGVKLPRPVQVAVVGDGERVHAERLNPVEQFGDPVGAVEERVLAVGVEVNERHTASGRYRRSNALSKARCAGYFAAHAPGRGAVRAEPADGPLTSRDRGR